MDVYTFRARELNTLGSARPLQTLGSRELGDEITPTLQRSVTPIMNVQALASFKAPGQGMTLALPQPARTWSTFQMSRCAGF